MKSLRRSFLLSLLILPLLTNRLQAVDPHTRLTQYGHTVWRVRDGAINSAPAMILQSNDGYMWIGTETGVLRFDGVRFVPIAAPELIDSQIDTLFIARDSTLWIATPLTMASVKDGKVTTVLHGHANQTVEDRQGRIWTTISRSAKRTPLCQVYPGPVHCFGADAGIPFPYGEGLDLDREGNLVMSSASQVIHWSPEKGLLSSYSFEALKKSETLSGISSILTDTDGSTLVSISIAGQGIGLQRLSGNVASALTGPGFDGSTVDASVSYRDKEHALWIGTYTKGLYRVTSSGTEHYTMKEGLSGDSVRDVREDREGNVWVATDQGVDCFRDLRVTTWSDNEGLPPGQMSSILASSDGSVLFGSHETLSIIRDQQISVIGPAQGLPENGVTALLEDHAHRIWMGTRNELAVYSGGRFKLIKRPDGQPAGAIYALVADADGSVWASIIGPTSEILHIKDDRIANVLSLGPPMKNIVADPFSGFWFADHARVGHYSNGQVQWIPSGLDVRNANPVIASVNGVVFAGSGSGVSVTRNGSARTLGMANGLPCQGINGMALSDKQDLVLRTTCGLILISSEALGAWDSQPGIRVPYRLIDAYDGAQFSRSSFWPQMSLAPDGRIWIANYGSIQVLDPDHVGTNSIVPPVHIEGLTADRIKHELRSGLTLPPLTRDIEIQYTALSFSLPQKVRFRYKLDGRDTVWQEPGTRRTAFYQDLKPGHYRFHVIAANNDGLWNTEGDAIDFTVKPAWFQTVWFHILWMAVVCLALWAIYHLRVRSIARAMSTRFDERLDERTRMALELHDTFLQTVQGSKMVADDALDPASDQLRMRHALEKLSAWLGQAVAEGRAALHALRVSTTEKNHLAEFLDRTAKEYSQRTSISVALTVIGDAVNLHPIVRDEIARIAEEAIRNACAHSNASQLSIELRYARDLSLCIRDNGVGIAPEVIDAGKSGHFGLTGMRERSARIRAKITITSTLNAGTQVILNVPGDVAYRREKKAVFNSLRSLTFWRGSSDAPNMKPKGKDDAKSE